MSVLSRVLERVFKLPPARTRDVAVEKGLRVPMRDGGVSPSGETVPVDLPFSSVWTALVAPASPDDRIDTFGRVLAKATGHRHAFDFVGLDAGLKRRRTGAFWQCLAGRNTVEDHYTWSRNVLTPLDGEVIAAGS